ncbi:glycosyltransferase family A protein [Kiritimatiellota bacterium B12222]|nr:glycosyltransferase family A protein [Kiritimatiellota bacterium B12222]
MAENYEELVSVILPLHNGERSIVAAIESIRAQTYAPIEILVVDDGSTDQGAEVVRTFSEVKYIHQAAQGVAAARNMGLNHAQGHFVAFLDQDDLWLPDKTRLQFELLTSQPNAVYALGWEHCVLEAGCERPCWVPENMMKEDHLGVHLGTMLARRSAFELYGHFDTQYRFASDFEWFVRIRKLGGVEVVLPQTVMHKSIHHTNESHHYKKMSTERMVILARLRSLKAKPSL